MEDFVESGTAVFRVAQGLSQKRDFSGLEDGGPVRAAWNPVLDYGDMTAYIRAWPDKLVSFVSQRLADDDLRYFTRELYEYICVRDADGPAFEEWRNT